MILVVSFELSRLLLSYFCTVNCIAAVLLLKASKTYLCYLPSLDFALTMAEKTSLNLMPKLPFINRPTKLAS